MDAQAEMHNPRCALRVHGLSKTFPGVQAMRSVHLEVAAGTVHAVLGHNGCGKSTLVKTLAGVHAPDPGGEAWIDGEWLEVGNPQDAERKGLRFVHQDLGLISELSAADNIGFVVGFERDRLGRISWRRQERATRDLLERFGFELDPRRPLAEASPAERTAVAIVRAVAGWLRGRGVVVLDEPTAALPAREVDELFRLIRDIRDTGTAVILVSHRLDEVMQIADRATIMRGGEVLWTGPLAETSTRELVSMIANTELEPLSLEPERNGRLEKSLALSRRPRREAALAIRGATAQYLRNVSLSVGTGEIVGVAGLLGSGREELPYVIAGAQTKGIVAEFEIGGAVFHALSVRRAQELGIVLVPSDRAREGIIADFTTRENVSLASLRRIAWAGYLQPARERGFASEWLSAVSADPAATERKIATLSGGNQQKAVLARWLSVDPKVLVLAEPTAGVDVGARAVIYEELRRRAQHGLAILVSSSDVEDLLTVCHRVIVLRDGEIVAELEGAEATNATIVAAMEGVHSEQQPDD